MTKQKRMIYIYEEHLEFYDRLVKDKKASQFINEAIKQAKKVSEPSAEESDPQIQYVRDRLAAMDAARGK